MAGKDKLDEDLVIKISGTTSSDEDEEIL